jgi:hypothetical protein
MKITNKIIISSKVALLLVVIGFFMPISCNGNGYAIGRMLLNQNSEFKDYLAGICFFCCY